ncbi:class I SAM-dependent methyltransferase [Patescibacteria group bacterium]
MSESHEWNEYAEGYDNKIFSLTKSPKRRKDILGAIQPGLILNLGAGSTNYLNRDLIAQGYVVIASDFCKKMLEVASRSFTHPNLRYVVTDSRSLVFPSGMFDTVVTANSILPRERKDVAKMFQESFRVLKQGGLFVAFLTSFENARVWVEELGEKARLDYKDLRYCDESDETGWQCYHTEESIRRELEEVGANNIVIKRVLLDSPEEIAEMHRIYKVDTSDTPVYEHFVTAWKNQ